MQAVVIVDYRFLFQKFYKLRQIKREIALFSMLIRLVLKMNPFSFFYFSAGVSNINRSPEQNGSKVLQYIIDERIPLLPLLNISQLITFQVNMTVIEENAIIQNRVNFMGGILQIKQHWYLYVANSKNGSGDETLLKDHFEFTTVRILSRVVKRISPPPHNNMLKNIRKYFEETLQGHYDNISA